MNNPVTRSQNIHDLEVVLPARKLCGKPPSIAVIKLTPTRRENKKYK